MIVPKLASKYWICDTCSIVRKWKPPQYPVTCIRGYCGWCRSNVEQMLTPCVDFDRGPGAPPIWD